MAIAESAYEVVKSKPANGIQSVGVENWKFLIGDGTPDGDASPWEAAAVGSLYLDIAGVNLYIKTAENGADADWVYFTQSV